MSADMVRPLWRCWTSATSLLAATVLVLATACGAPARTAPTTGASGPAPNGAMTAGPASAIPPDRPGWWLDHLPSPHPPVFTFVSDELFAFNQATLLSGVDRVLASALARIGAGRSGPVYELSAHADLVGCEGPGQLSVCIGLTERRANAARQWFIDHGVAPERLTTRGAGALEPLTTDPGDQPRNRRIELRPTGAGR